MIVAFAYVVGCRVAVAQEGGLERPAHALKASNGQSCRMTTTVFIYCPSEKRLLRKKLRALVWGEGRCRAGFSGKLYMARIFPKLPDCRFQMLWPKTKLPFGLAFNGQKWSGRLRNGQKCSTNFVKWPEIPGCFQTARNGLGGFPGGFEMARNVPRSFQMARRLHMARNKLGGFETARTRNGLGASNGQKSSERLSNGQKWFGRL